MKAMRTSGGHLGELISRDYLALQPIQTLLTIVLHSESRRVRSPNLHLPPLGVPCPSSIIYIKTQCGILMSIWVEVCFCSCRFCRRPFHVFHSASPLYFSLDVSPAGPCSALMNGSLSTPCLFVLRFVSSRGIESNLFLDLLCCHSLSLTLHANFSHVTQKYIFLHSPFILPLFFSLLWCLSSSSVQAFKKIYMLSPVASSIVTLPRNSKLHVCVIVDGE